MNPIDKIYNQRKKFSVIALTGVTGSGCTELAKMMASPFKDLNVRESDDILDNHKKDYQVFKRKYERAHRLLSNKEHQYKIISYKNVVVLEAIILLVDDNKGNECERFLTLVNNDFEPSKDTPEYEGCALDLNERKLNEWGFNQIVKQIQGNIEAIHKWETKKNDWRKFLSTFFFNELFNGFCDYFFNYLKSKDYYLKNLLVHRLSNAIRSFANPEIRVDYKDENSNWYYMKADMENMFLLIGVINDIIKGSSHDDERNFVIDSLRCSLEIVYMRERYNAFYMIAMHNEHRFESIKNKVKTFVANEEKSDRITHYIEQLGVEEIKAEHYENGVFSVPDIYNCIACSEIHIFKKDDIQNDKLEFYTTAEQWMKIHALILHPGLFTPSSDERCMSIAYQLKFNSGCISRQVGCVITDANYVIKSIGWNDVPLGQIPCGLSDVEEFLQLDNQAKDTDNLLYSKFEYEGKVTKSNNDLFKDLMRKEYAPEKIKKVNDAGLHIPFCFKSCYNKFQDERDNVNTRSLHAEENTMLQVSKNGGIGLDGGKMYVTASPCVLCSKKAYQIGIKEIIYLDKYTDIAEEQILEAGYNKPVTKGFCGIIGPTYYKLYQPFMSYKDELLIRLK